MLIAKVTPNAGGLLLAGDQLDLNTLHECLHLICPKSEEHSRNPDNLILQLAYEVRKALMGNREQIGVPCDWMEQGKNTYRGAILSFPRAMIQYAFLCRLMFKSKTISTAGRADILAFGAAIISALQQLEIKNAEKLVDAVTFSVMDWKKWPGHCLIDTIDIAHLYGAKTKAKRIAGIKRLPSDLREQGPLATNSLRSRLASAEQYGVSLDAIGIEWPDEPPTY